MSAAQPLSAAERIGTYQAQNKSRRLTPRQNRRVIKKSNSSLGRLARWAALQQLAGAR